ncbi:MAG TPA: monovalent cation/H+ antiporter subunit D [Arenimonas sp.]|uniref:monovalent cation/H+ antiporter subunit D n=1 Tax=Arenimonas sp. TaxID=1872635 RepID=UPI002D80E41B|nr:monovalent cation/H+ antiporter subunit D [Arenimonas sp.]HEU0152272.1 monovalent cation/H+ antiporter subunit D [Arenimonas sp.]
MSPHLLVAPILLPLFAGLLLLVLGTRRARVQRWIGSLSCLGLVGIAAALALQADDGGTRVYLVGNWAAHLGIALVGDRLSAIMLLATALLALPCLVFAFGGWDRRAPHFHALFQLQLMGLNGAFLTGDLFNLFVFFEVLLIASYGLLLSGGRGLQMRSGLQYVAFNITASTLFLVALGFIYGLTGALNMAELAHRIGQAPAGDVAMLRAAGGLLLVMFCAKAALLPLYFWLPETYARSPAAVAAMFAIMTKLGVYAVLRVFSLVFGAEAGELAGLAWPWLLPLGTATLVLATLGALAAPSLRLLAAYLVLGSAATLFIALGLASAEAVGAGLYYLVHSTLVGGALFLLADLVRKQRDNAGDSLRKIDRMGPKALLGSLFLVAALSVAGLPPLSGFIGKFSLLAAVPAAQATWLWPVLLVTSLLGLVALATAGSHLFWREGGDVPAPGRVPALRRSEVGATVALLALGVLLAVFAGPALRYAQDAGKQVMAPAGYIEQVRGAQPQPGVSP